MNINESPLDSFITEMNLHTYFSLQVFFSQNDLKYSLYACHLLATILLDADQEENDLQQHKWPNCHPLAQK